MEKRRLGGAILILLVLVFTACSISKEPAERAIKSAEAAFNAVKEETLKYAPAETRDLEKAILAAKDKYDRNDYDAALKSATALPDKINQLVTLAGARKTEWVRNWEALGKELSAMTDAVQARIEDLTKRRKLPPGIDRAKLDEARAAQASVTQMWTEAKDTYEAGRLMDAVAKAKSARDKAVEAMTGLGLQVQEAPIQ
ncbi:MAG TPA: hypothetical protein P5551_00130 [Syntrophales bacterium]|nr:hypothetical protein [Syntrophales bacterium]HRT60752.1 hypothetical protein [Syntrophales bacterium]